MPLPFSPVPPASAAIRLMRFAGNHGSVRPGFPAVDEDPAIAAVGNGVAGDRQGAALDSIEACHRGRRDAISGNAPATGFGPDAVRR